MLHIYFTGVLVLLSGRVIFNNKHHFKMSVATQAMLFYNYLSLIHYDSFSVMKLLKRESHEILCAIDL